MSKKPSRADRMAVLLPSPLMRPVIPQPIDNRKAHLGVNEVWRLPLPRPSVVSSGIAGVSC